MKADLARLCNERTAAWAAASTEWLAGPWHLQAKVMASTAFLTVYLGKVPTLVIVTVIGRHDEAGAGPVGLGHPGGVELLRGLASAASGRPWLRPAPGMPHPHSSANT